MPPDAELPGLTDSKLLTPSARVRLAEMIRAQAVAYAVAAVEASQIDATNILRATLRRHGTGGVRSCPAAGPGPGGREYGPPLTVPARWVIRGDRLVPAISAASILAKVTRDAIMDEWAVRFPAYGFAQHKGYGTAAHRSRIAAIGPCSIHRKTFAGVREHLGGAGAQGSLW